MKFKQLASKVKGLTLWKVSRQTMGTFLQSLKQYIVIV